MMFSFISVTELVPWAIGVIMLGIGLNIPFKSLKRVFTEPKAIICGLTLQMILLPLVGFALAMMWDLPPAQQVGLVLIASCPGGTASNLVTHLLKGRTALSVSLTSFNSFLIIFTVPWLTGFSTDLFMNDAQAVTLSLTDVVIELVTTVVFPVLIGMTVRHLFYKLAVKLHQPLRYILPLILVTVFVLVSIVSRDGLRFSFQSVVWPALVLNVVTVCIGFIVSRIIGLSPDGQFTIAIEMGLQNSALAIFIATSVLQSPEIAIVAVIYGSFSFFSTVGVVLFLKKILLKM